MRARWVPITLLALFLSGCGHAVTVDRLDLGDFYCESIDEHSLEGPESKRWAESCGITIHFDWPLGHKLPGEK